MKKRNKEKPTKIGWYWVKYSDVRGEIFSPLILNLYLSASGLRIREFLDLGNIMSSILVKEWNDKDTLWAGPIEKPEE